MTDISKRSTPAILTLLLLVAGAVPAGSVTDLPAVPDSLGSQLQDQDTPFGSGTTWMIGMTLVEQGDLAGALPYLAQAWRMSPGEVELGEVYRDVLLELGYIRDALEVSRSVLAAQPDDAPTLEQHVIILASLESFDEALDMLRLLKVDHSERERLDRLEGEILVRARRWPAARDHFRHLLVDDPDDHERLTATLSEILVMLGELDEAGEVWRSAVSRHPESRPLRLGAIQFDVARGFDRQALYAAVEADSIDAVLADPAQDTEWVSVTAGMIVGAGRVDSAKGVLLELAAEHDLGIESTLLLVRILDTTDENSRALSLLRDAVERWPSDPRPRIYLGEFLAMGGDLDAAERSVRKAMELAPNAVEGRFSLISILSRRYPEAYESPRSAAADSVRVELYALAQEVERSDRAITPPSHLMLGATLHGLDKPLESVPHFEAAAEDPEYIRDALLNLSLVYEDLDRPAKVLEVLERLHAARPDDAVVNNALGYTMADQNVDLERAETMIRMALATDPDNPAYLDSLGWVLYRRGQDVEAFDFLVRATNAQPEDPVILEHLARVLMRLGQEDRARSVAHKALLAGGDPDVLADLLSEQSGP